MAEHAVELDIKEPALPDESVSATLTRLSPGLPEKLAANRLPAAKKIAKPAPARTARVARPAAKEIRIASQPGFVLHSYPYKETSLIIDVFSRDHGRVALVAKGAKRPHSKLRSVLQTFQPLTMGWTGKSDIRTLIDAEWVGGMLPLEKSALLCGFYLNELLIKFMVRDDPHPALFDHYVSTLNQLAHNEPASIVLRKFELALLRESGLVGNLTLCTLTRRTVFAQEYYVIDPELGARPARPADAAPRVLGKTLTDMHAGNYQDPTTQAQSKLLMRYLLAHHLHGSQLNTRQILIDLQNL
ncbi:DNA repair protein RecO [Undibacterium sp.]|uniref:DNA repair protein RecO n=1 Tax=Undibacterium sp. TaxID=1914977 RepID=UPI002CED5BF4|nr:DNA repair protein RecO [Undibacterium sp.]HTD02956.1 DNA repair protein RecO [Undibacterium sp.]